MPLHKQAAALLQQTFHRQATHTARAPGRVNLIGEHIDYCGGHVLPFAIEQHIHVAAALNNRQKIRIASSHSGETVTIDLNQPIEPAEPSWANYPRGVVHLFQEHIQSTLPGFDVAIVSNLPTGAGLSSSAALELAVATLLEKITSTALPLRTKALLCQKAEHEFAGVPCGIMDQFASAYGQRGQLVLIDCQKQDAKLIPLTEQKVSLIIANTNVSHELSSSAYADRLASVHSALKTITAATGKTHWRQVTAQDIEATSTALGETNYRRARHIVSEMQRSLDAVTAIQQTNIPLLGELMHASHLSLRDDYEVSCHELDIMVDIAQSIGLRGGVYGSRMTGGGFGGSTITLCEVDQADAIIRHMSSRYQSHTGITPDIFKTHPSDGAC
ncbi:MAG: galactokinase [Akkermansiaceae bacterium]